MKFKFSISSIHYNIYIGWKTENEKIKLFFKRSVTFYDILRELLFVLLSGVIITLSLRWKCICPAKEPTDGLETFYVETYALRNSDYINTRLQ